MPPILIEPYDEGAIAAITQIYAHAVRHGTASFELDPPGEDEMLRRFAAFVANGFPCLVARDASDRTLCGYAYASSFRGRPAYRWCVENSVYVDERHHGRGIGKALTAALIERCEALGFRQMIAVIGGIDNAASKAMHAALGFDHVGVLPATGFKHGRWLDSVLMQRPLGDGKSTAPDPDSYPGTLYRAGQA